MIAAVGSHPPIGAMSPSARGRLPEPAPTAPADGVVLHPSALRPLAAPIADRVRDLARLPLPVPADVLGTNDYYRWRDQDFHRRHPDEAAPTYYLGYGDKYAKRFSNELAPRLSAVGQVWVAGARRQLQQAMEQRRAQDPAAFDALEQNSNAFRRFAYGTHVNAYMAAGFAYLPPSDLLKVGLTPGPRDLLNVAGLAQVMAVAKRMPVSMLVARMTPAASPLVRGTVQVGAAGGGVPQAGLVR